jgi:ketosteroid isomerase-like protein
MMATTDRDFFDGYLDAWNAHDPAAVARYMADDAIYEDVALGRVLHGPSEIAEQVTRASSDFRFEEVPLFTAGGAEMFAQLGIQPPAPPQPA